MSLRLPVCFMMAVVSVGLPSALSAAEPNTDLLKSLILPEDKLPESLTAFKFPAEIEEKLGFAPPGVTTKPESIKSLIEDFSFETEPANTEAVMFAWYQGSEKDFNSLLFTLGFQQKTKEQADELVTALKKTAPEAEEGKETPFRIFQKSNIVVVVAWGDSVPEDGRKALIAHIEKTMQKQTEKP